MNTPPSLFPEISSSPDLIIYSDGGSRGNPGPAATGYVIQDSNGTLLHAGGNFLGEATNNTAEYQAVLDALTLIVDQPNSFPASISSIHIYVDSKLIANQLGGNYKIKQPHLIDLAVQINTLISDHHLKVVYHQVPRDQNQAADAQVNKILDAKVGPRY